MEGSVDGNGDPMLVILSIESSRLLLLSGTGPRKGTRGSQRSGAEFNQAHLHSLGGSHSPAPLLRTDSIRE